MEPSGNLDEFMGEFEEEQLWALQLVIENQERRIRVEESAIKGEEDDAARK